MRVMSPETEEFLAKHCLPVVQWGEIPVSEYDVDQLQVLLEEHGVRGFDLRGDHVGRVIVDFQHADGPRVGLELAAPVAP